MNRLTPSAPSSMIFKKSIYTYTSIRSTYINEQKCNFLSTSPRLCSCYLVLKEKPWLRSRCISLTHLRPFWFRFKTFKFGKCLRKTKSICAILLPSSLKLEAILSSIGIGGWVRLRPLQLTKVSSRPLLLLLSWGQWQSWGQDEAEDTTEAVDSLWPETGKNIL